MDGLKLKTEQDLRIYCLTVTPYDDGAGEEAKRGARFILAYNAEEIANIVVRKFMGRNISYVIHGSVEAEKLLEKITTAEKKETEQITNMVVSAPSPEMKRESFMMGLMLAADRFVGPEDSKTIKDILKRSSMKPSEIHSG